MFTKGKILLILVSSKHITNNLFFLVIHESVMTIPVVDVNEKTHYGRQYTFMVFCNARSIITARLLKSRVNITHKKIVFEK